MQNIEDKKIFLLVSSSESKLQWMQDIISRHISKPTIYVAHDGLMAINKLKNAPPHVLITELELPKLPGIKLVDQTLATRDAEGTAIIIASHPPFEGVHLDEIVTGRVQYFTVDNDEGEFISCVTKALNFSSYSGASTEFRVRFLAPGEVLVREGEKADFVFFVKKGQLQAMKIVDGNEVTLGTIEYGEFVGEMAYINGEARSATVRALVECELIEVPIGMFEKVLFKRPSWSKALMLTLTKRLKAANNEKTPNYSVR